MNILDITQEDIERWKIGLRTSELTDRDSEVRKLIGEDHFGFRTESYLKANYQLPSPTEAEIIKYLQASEVYPAQWHPAAQEWARRHEGEDIWEFQTECGNKNFWIKTSYISDSVGIDTEHVHRLRADYGKKDDPVCKRPIMDKDYFLEEPEVCVWDKHCNSRHWYKDPHGEHWFMPFGDIQKNRFCPVCGKKITVKEKE